MSLEPDIWSDRSVTEWLSTGWITGLGFLAVSLNFLCHHFLTQISGCSWFLCCEYWGLFWMEKWPKPVDLLCSFVILEYDITSTSVSSWCGRKATLWLSGMFLRWEIMDTDIMSSLYERKMIGSRIPPEQHFLTCGLQNTHSVHVLHGLSMDFFCWVHF